MTSLVLDTNVVSETARPRPDATMQAWFARQRLADMYLTATVVGEIAAGIAVLPHGKKRQVLQLWQDELRNVAFAGRILPFDTQAALTYAQIIAQARRAGSPAHIADAQIAAVALVHGLAVATRDVADFAGFGVALVNPFEGA